ncbi:response regulator [Mesorhizobium sp. CAU 1741]|uniref:response regulator n=1 Tax=Mesorhizobium sp. CAU 1741 TaxID=3140366 RepID=UPI00325B7C01
MNASPLDGLRVLLMEDEFLIAMDVEQLCRDHGAADVTIAQTIDALGPDPFAGDPFHVAILDVRLAGHTTIDFARQLAERGIPFIFATGYADGNGTFEALHQSIDSFEVVIKPYGSEDLMGALTRAISRKK